MQYHEVKLYFTFEGTTIMGDAGVQTSSDPDVSLYVDYVYLDTDERRRFAQVSHEYLITQIQFTGDETSDGASGKLRWRPRQATWLQAQQHAQHSTAHECMCLQSYWAGASLR